MASNIKGITIELDGDTRGLQKALSDVDKASRNLASELKQVERALKLDPGNLELIGQKQELLSQQVDHTTTRLNRLRAAQKQVEEQFQRGDIGADKFRAFQREIITTEKRLSNLERELKSLDDAADMGKVSAELKNVDREADKASKSIADLSHALDAVEAFGGFGADLLTKSVEQALDSAHLDTVIEINFEVPESSKKSIKDAINAVKAYGVDAEDALEGVRRQWALNRNASDSANAAIVKGAAAIAQAYKDIDFKELIQESHEVGKELKISQKEALGLINALLKVGFPPEQLDIISEYGQQLKRAGFEAEEIQAIFAAGIETGTWNIDNLLDGLKEGRIRLAGFGDEIPKAMKPMLKDAGIAEQQITKWGKAVAKGGADGRKAMVDVAKALNGVRDETLKNTLGVQIFGTMYEDQGQNIIDTLINAEKKTIDLRKNQEQLNDAIQKMGADPMVRLSEAAQTLQEQFKPILSVIADIAGAFADFAKNNPKIVATFTVLVGIVGVLGATFGLLAGAAALFGTSLGVAAGSISGVIALLVGLSAAIGEAIQKFSWDAFVDELKIVKTTTIEVLKDIKNFLVELGNAIADGFTRAVDRTKTDVETIGKLMLDGLKATKESAIAILNELVQYFVGLGVSMGTGLLTDWNVAIGALLSLWNKVKVESIKTWEAVKNNVRSAVDGAKNNVTAGWRTAQSTVVNIWNSIRSAATNVWNSIRSTITNVVNAIKNTVSSGFNTIRSTAINVWNSIRQSASSAWSSIRSVISNGISSAYNVVRGFAGRFRSAGVSLMSTLADGIRSGINKAVSAVRNGMASIRAYLPFSPAKVGPLSDLDKSGESFFPTFASKMNRGVTPMLRAISDGLRQASLITTQAVQVPEIAVPNVEVNNAAQPVNNTVNVHLDGNIFIDNDYRVRELGTVISQSLQRDATITRRAQGVRVYAPR
jgi:phage-related minor tail protein